MDGGAKYEILSLTVKNSLDVGLSSSYERTVEHKKDITENYELTRVFEVGPHSIGEMFRLNYKGPGVEYATDTISTNGTLPLDKVLIHCKVRRIPMIKNIRVVYSDQSLNRPINVISVSNGGNPDVNTNQGRYTWLVAEWTTKLVSDFY